MKRALVAAALLLVPGLVAYRVAGSDPVADSVRLRSAEMLRQAQLLRFEEATESDVESPPSARVVPVSRLIGIPVTNPLHEEIGVVADVVLDEYGCTAGMVIHVGGFFGIGGQYVRLPIDKVNIRRGVEAGSLIVLVRETRQHIISRE